MPASSVSCPFCISAENSVVDIGGNHPAHVHCDNCGADGPPRKTWAEAIDAWETRPEPGAKGDGGNGR